MNGATVQVFKGGPSNSKPAPAQVVSACESISALADTGGFVLFENISLLVRQFSFFMVVIPLIFWIVFGDM